MHDVVPGGCDTAQPCAVTSPGGEIAKLEGCRAAAVHLNKRRRALAHFERHCRWEVLVEACALVLRAIHPRSIP